MEQAPGELRCIIGPNGAGKTTLLVEQYYDFARELADAYYVMERGEMLAQGRGEDMERDGVRKLVAI